MSDVYILFCECECRAMSFDATDRDRIKQFLAVQKHKYYVVNTMHRHIEKTVVASIEDVDACLAPPDDLVKSYLDPPMMHY